jgi:sulfite oxidase
LIHGTDNLNSGAWPIPTDKLITPTELFFTRSHAPVPSIDSEAWRLEVSGLVERPISYSLADLLRRFPRREITATIACAGLRRAEFLDMGPLPGELPWGPEPISTGCWSGVSLAEVLQEAGVKKAGRHVEFVGLDEVERHGARFGFGGSIDLDKARGDEVLLATGLNGGVIPPQHGFPVRAVVPGWIGARSVKWLGRIVVREDPSPNYFQNKAYRHQREIDERDPRDVSRGVALTELPLNSVIVHPDRHDVVRAGHLKVTGWAIGGGGRAVSRVELSMDGGSTWSPAKLSKRGVRWSWSFWEAEVELSRGGHMLVVRATDSGGTTQPATLDETWNVKGYNNNAWHRVPVHAE